MTNFADLGALNKSSARVATFVVRVVGAKASEYTFTSKRDNKDVKAHTFEAWLIGVNPEAYCIGYVKGSQAVIAEAQKKYVEGSVWRLAKVAFDTFTALNFINTPVP